MSTYGASGLMGQWLESTGAFGAVPGGPVFEAETSYGAVPGGPVFQAEAAYGAEETGDAIFGALASVSLSDELAYGQDEITETVGALDSVSLQDQLAYGGEDEDFGALASLSLTDELAYGAVSGGPVFQAETAYGAEPAGNVYESEMAYGGDDAVFGIFEKATAKSRIAKLYRISARIQYLVDMGKVDVAREKAKKLLAIWAKLSAMSEAQPLISAALQDEMAHLSAFASGQTNNPHDAAGMIQPGVAVDPTMTAGGTSLFSTNLDALYSDAAPSADAGGYAQPSYAPVVTPVVAPVPVYARPLYAPPPRRVLPPAFRPAPGLRRGRFGAMDEGEDYGAVTSSATHTYHIRRGPGKGTNITSTLDKAAFGRCRRLAGNLRSKDVAYVGNGTFRTKGGKTFSITDAAFLQECSRVSKIADKGQSFGSSGDEA